MKVNLDRKIGVLTYDIQHRKTYDTLCLLKAKGYKYVHVYAQPLHYQKKYWPLVNHRPSINVEIPETDQLCNNFNYCYHKNYNIETIRIPRSMVFLICGAGILPQEFVNQYTIVNAHPGYIPFARGLDAYKWAIWEEKPVGVTTHVVGENIDAGEIIERRVIPVFTNDSFYELAMRVYENEIQMLVDSLEHLDEEHEYIEPNGSDIHKRMPHELEKDLLKKFQIYKQRHGVNRKNHL